NAFRVINRIAAPSLKALERILDVEGREVAVVNQIEVAGTGKARVGQIQHPLVEVVAGNTQGQRLATFEEVAARTRRDPVDIVVEGNARRQRERGAERIVVDGARGKAIAPREAGREAAHLGDRIAQVATETISAAAGVRTVALVTKDVVVRQVPDIGGAKLANHGDLVGLQEIAGTKQLGQGELRLGDLMPLPARDLGTRSVLTQLALEAQAGLRDQRVERRQRGEQQLHVVNLQRQVRAIAHLTLPCPAT